MAPNCVAVDSAISSDCSGLCQYSRDISGRSSCQCLSLDTSQEVPIYILKLARALQRVVQHNDADTHTVSDKPSSFHCRQTPPISIRAYVQRIAKHSKCSPVCFIMAWSYLKRISQNHAELTVTSLTVHRLLITAVMLAAKLMDDKYFNNAYYAKIGGVAMGDLNWMELDMLRLLDYRIVVTGPQIQQLLIRLDVFQTPGRLNSVLCRKRSIDFAAPPLPVGVHKPKTSKGCVVTQRARQPIMPCTKLQSNLDQHTVDRTLTGTLYNSHDELDPVVLIDPRTVPVALD
ncbi:hypothetical protein WJX79_010294 [Trebouxia sp. C0005]